MEAAQVSINRWMNKISVVHLHNRIPLGHKKQEKFTLCVRIDGPGDHFTKWNKPVRGKPLP